MAGIARRFGVTLTRLIAQNPHIPNSNVLYPGDILCIPGAVRRPCCAVLSIAASAPPLPLEASGAVLVDEVPAGYETVAIMAINLPPPSQFGRYGGYQAVIETMARAGPYSFRLFQPGPPAEPGAVSLPPTWSGMTTIPSVLTPQTRVSVRPFGPFTGEQGPAILEANLGACLAASGRRPGE